MFWYAAEVRKVRAHVLTEVRAGVHPAFCTGMSGARSGTTLTQAPHTCLGDPAISLSLEGVTETQGIGTPSLG